MSINLIKALVSTLESAHRIATELGHTAENERKSEVADTLGSFLGALKIGGNGSGETSGKAETNVAADTPVADTPVADTPVADTPVS